VTESPSAEEMIALLTDPARAVEPVRFPHERDSAAGPGMYGWWGDNVAQAILGEAIGGTLPPLLYVGQAGATKWPSGKRSSATLESRIRNLSS